MNIHSCDWRLGVLILLKSILKVKDGVGSCACYVLLFGELSNPFPKRLRHFFVPTAHFPPLTKHSLFSVSFVRNIPMSVK